MKRVRTRNIFARLVRSPFYRQRVVKNKKKYDRKKFNKSDTMYTDGDNT